MKEVIDHKKIKIPANYCLILPDEDYKHFHIDGKESVLEIGRTAMVYMDPTDARDHRMKESMDTHANHWAITGVVYQAPQRLRFYGGEMQSILKRPSLSDIDIEQVKRLADASVKYEVDMEVKNGDRVVFDPQVHITVTENSEYIDTDLGRMYLVKYDRLRGVIREDGVYPLNGVVLFRWVQDKEITFGGLTLAVQEKRIWDAEHKDGMIGEVVSSGQPVKSMIVGWQSVYVTSAGIEPGDRILFRSLDANNFEMEGHFHLFGGEEILMIRQESILGILEQNTCQM